MPYVSISTSQHLTDDKVDRIQKEIGRLISIIPGKTIDNCMIRISGDQKIFMSGKPANATFCEIRMRNKAPIEKKQEFTVELNKLLTEEIEGLDKLYINMQEYFEWGVGPSYTDS